MTWALDPIEISARRVLIRNYSEKDFVQIAESINDPQGWFGRNWGFDAPGKVHAMLGSLLAAQAKGLHNALVYCVGKEVAGITRLMRIESANKSLEIGGTWVAPRWRKSFVNTEVKFQLLQYCFETLYSERVEFRVDARNIESQRAVLRIGAKLEGRLRNRQIYPDGVARDGFLFTVVRNEWPQTKMHLHAMLNDPLKVGNTQTCFPQQIETPRLILRPYKIEDAEPLYNMVEKNRSDLLEDFPTTFRQLSKREDVEGYIYNKLHEWHTKTFFRYGVFLKSSAEHIGQLHIKNLNWEVRSAELGYFLDIDQRQKGYGSEMLESAVNLCLKEKAMRRIFVRIVPTNHPSIGLAQKHGFQYEGLHRREFLNGSGELKDLCYYSVIQN